MSDTAANTMEQIEAIKILAEAAHQDKALIVSEIGSQTCWLNEAADHPANLYLSGPMGMAPSVALGVALARPDRAVLGICGDGALAMNFSALVTMANEAPRNLTLALMDNAVYDFTGKIASPSKAVDWEKMVAGLPAFESFEKFDASKPYSFSPEGGLSFIHCLVKPATRKPAPFPYSGPEIYKRFSEALQES